jgi:hypothetical protein
MQITEVYQNNLDILNPIAGGDKVLEEGSGKV